MALLPSPLLQRLHDVLGPQSLLLAAAHGGGQHGGDYQAAMHRKPTPANGLQPGSGLLSVEHAHEAGIGHQKMGGNSLLGFGRHGNGLTSPIEVALEHLQGGGPLSGFGSQPQGGQLEAPIGPSASGIDAAVAGYPDHGVINPGFHHFVPAPAEGPTGSHGEQYTQPIRRRPGLAQALAALQPHPPALPPHLPMV